MESLRRHPTYPKCVNRDQVKQAEEEMVEHRVVMDFADDVETMDLQNMLAVAIIMDVARMVVNDVEKVVHLHNMMTVAIITDVGRMVVDALVQPDI